MKGIYEGRCTMKKWLLVSGVMALLVYGIVYKYTTPSLDHLAHSIYEVHNHLPGHYKITAATSRIHNDDDMGCWLLLGKVQQNVEVFYTDDDYALHQKHITIDRFISWLKIQNQPDIWVYDNAMHIKNRGRFFKIIAIEQVPSHEDGLFIHVQGSNCHFHEGHAVNMYGSIGLDAAFSLAQNERDAMLPQS